MGIEALQGFHFLLEITWRREQLNTTLMLQFLGTIQVVQNFGLKTHRGLSCGYEPSGKILDLFFLPSSTMVETKSSLLPSVCSSFLVHLDIGGTPALPGVACKSPYFLFPIPCIVTKINASSLLSLVKSG